MSLHCLIDQLGELCSRVGYGHVVMYRILAWGFATRWARFGAAVDRDLGGSRHGDAGGVREQGRVHLEDRGQVARQPQAHEYGSVMLPTLVMFRLDCLVRMRFRLNGLGYTN